MRLTQSRISLSRSHPPRPQARRRSRQSRKSAPAPRQDIAGDHSVRGSVADRSKPHRSRRKSSRRETERQSISRTRAPLVVLNRALHLNLDDAWRDVPVDFSTLDARAWGPTLRFCAPARIVENFYREFGPRLAPFILYGSGDYHYLSALWLRRCNEPLVLVSFDNHPDWAITPPKWACGGWINRALELPQVQHVAIWGCGNFECWWPHNFFANRSAQRSKRLEVHPWADDRPMKDRQRAGVILRENWRDQFEKFAANLRGAN